ncbi:uncharacterized protein LOC142586268 [Dermacentor variabilis]|uniref:uncharacterized protein LOC142586268 n=1 Tax=Dermacentor variabilis TaxID=34621 RepID=UPI003F5C7337
MATPSNGATAEPVEASAPITGPPHLRPALKPSPAASPPYPLQRSTVSTAALPVKAAIAVATTAASTAAHAAVSAAASLETLAMLKRNSPGGRQGTSQAGGDQRPKPGWAVPASACQACRPDPTSPPMPTRRPRQR